MWQYFTNVASQQAWWGEILFLLFLEMNLGSDTRRMNWNKSIRRIFHNFHSFTAWNIETILELVFTLQNSSFDKDTLTSRKHIAPALTLSLAHLLLYKETPSQGGQTLSPHQTRPSLKPGWSVRRSDQSQDLPTNISLLMSQEVIPNSSGFAFRKSNDCFQDHCASHPSLQIYQVQSEIDEHLRC